jgi:alpha-tubulin suppressor-like RCC1 family protein
VLPPETSTWISAGRYNSFAGVLGVGGNYYGQLGIGPAGDPASNPGQDHYTYNPPVSGKAVAGFEFSYYVEAGKVMVAGGNELGQLGNGTFSPIDTPNPIFAPVLTGDWTPLSDVRTVVAGSSFGVAVKYDGTVWTWGANNYGQLGDGTLENRAYAALVTGLPPIIAVSASTGRYLPPPLDESPVHDHVLALASNGTVWGWGENRDGECGSGTPGVPVTDPILVSDPVTVPVQVRRGPGT